jgi:hypothetical protein
VCECVISYAARVLLLFTAARVVDRTSFEEIISGFYAISVTAQQLMLLEQNNAGKLFRKAYSQY